MIELRVAASDADLELWRQVRLAVSPDERCPTVEELRRRAAPGSLYLVAELDGALAGSGISGRSDLGGAFLMPRVVPGLRRRGVGSELLRALAAHAAAIGYAQAIGHVGDPGSLAFAEGFGFREIGRQVGQVRKLRPDEPPATPPPGIELISLAEEPGLFGRAYDELAAAVLADVPVPRRPQVSREDWLRDWQPWPAASFVAVLDGAIVGYAGLYRDDTRAEHSLTAVRRDLRGRGLAKALKQAEAEAAARHGVRELTSWTQDANVQMQAVNRALGYVQRDVSISIAAALPL
jgi:GNAT superfamily N-acetyltransferase